MEYSKKRLVILGTGFAGFGVLKNINLKLFDVTVVSERNYFLFTPLLPSTTVGTIEFRSIIEPVRSVGDGVKFHQGRATRLNSEKKTLACMGQFDGREFSVSYDYLVVAVGAVNNTFGVPGVHEHAFFLKDLRDARKIRQRIIDNFESASTPGLDVGEIQRFLHFVVVGGGPTGVEFAAELTDLLEGELAKAYSHLVGAVRITLIEAGKQILNSYDEKISNYATKLFNRRRVEVLTNKPVKIVEEQSLQLQDGTVLNYGLLVWSTGNGQTAFVNSLNFQKDKTGKLLTDGYFRLNNSNDIFAVGDNANMNGLELPATAQVAGQSGKYLGKLLTRIAKNTKIEKLPVFKFKNLGMLAYIGGNRAVADLPAGNAGGFSTWIFWRSAYLTKLVSLKNKVLVLFDWFKAAMFGRDISRF